MVDVDGSFLYKKQQLLKQTSVHVTPLPRPSPPLSGWEVVSDSNVGTISLRVPVLTPGKYLLLCL